MCWGGAWVEGCLVLGWSMGRGVCLMLGWGMGRGVCLVLGWGMGRGVSCVGVEHG